MKATVLIICTLFTLFQNRVLFAQFEENNGQHPSQVYASAVFQNTALFLEKDKLTYTIIGEQDGGHTHTVSCNAMHEKLSYSFQMTWLGARTDYSYLKEGAATYQTHRITHDGEFHNGTFASQRYAGLYEGIDFIAKKEGENFKYDYVVSAGADPNQIRWSYRGAESFAIGADGTLAINTPLGTVTEAKPYAYQKIGNVESSVECAYMMTEDGSLRFAFPNGYDTSKELIIDPTVIASTLMGSTTISTNAFCSDYDNAGNIYAAGRGFGVGYPVTIGAVQTVNGGQWDMVLTKLNPTGTAIIYSTYIGGSLFDQVHSVDVQADGSVYLLGITASTNFPTRPGAFDLTYNGGTYDYAVLKINPSGSSLDHSTFLGGSGNDGDNLVLEGYGDEARSDIQVKDSEVWIVGCSSSPNFPVTAGAYQTTKGSGQDGIVARINSALSGVTMSTFIGGSNNDAVFNMLLHDNGRIYVCGTIAGESLEPSAVSGMYDNTFNGGARDGFIGYFNSVGSFKASYWGTDSTDILHIIDQTQDGAIYVAGGTLGLLPIIGTSYGTINTPQSITKIDADLTTVSIQTTIGSSMPAPKYDFNPTAIMVDSCERVILVGASGVNGAISGLPLTPDAIDVSAGFYMAAFEPLLAGLDYGTYYGGANDHSHPGQGRFDKDNLTLYQTTCTPVGAMFPTLPGSVASTQVSTEMSVFKFKFDICSPPVVVLPDSCAGLEINLPDTLRSCVGGAVKIDAGPFGPSIGGFDDDFIDLGGSGLGGGLLGGGGLGGGLIGGCGSYLWSTGATTQSITVTTPGVYTVKKVFPNCCEAFDTVVVIFAPAIKPNLGPDASLCPTGSRTLNAGTGYTAYNWSTGENTPSITVSTPGLYTVEVVDARGCSNSDTVRITDLALKPNLGADATICADSCTTLEPATPTAWVSFLWNTGATTPFLEVCEPGNYILTVTDAAGCQNRDTIRVSNAPYCCTKAARSRFCTGYFSIEGHTSRVCDTENPKTYRVNHGGAAMDYKGCVGSYTITVYMGFKIPENLIYTETNTTGMFTFMYWIPGSRPYLPNRYPALMRIEFTNYCTGRTTYKDEYIDVRNDCPSYVVSYRVAPNPSKTGIFTIVAFEGEAVIRELPKRVRVLDVLGKRLFTTEVRTNELDLSHLANGMYILEIENQEGTVSKQKIIIQR